MHIQVFKDKYELGKWKILYLDTNSVNALITIQFFLNGVFSTY